MEFTGERFMPSVAGEIACEHMNRYHFVVNQLDIVNKKVLDIASGEGYGTFLLAQHAGYVYGVDISTEAVEHAKNKYKRENLSFQAGNAIDIPLESNSIDIIVSFETIEHLEGHQRMIDEIKRVMKTDGILVLSSPDKLDYNEINDGINHFHVKEMAGNEFKELVNKNFATALFFNQKMFVGSMIALEGSNSVYKIPLIIDSKGNKYYFKPRYNIAIATDNENLLINHSIINYTEGISMEISESDLQQAKFEGQLEVNNSLSYKIGAAILKPLKAIKGCAKILFA